MYNNFYEISVMATETAVIVYQRVQKNFDVKVLKMDD